MIDLHTHLLPGIDDGPAELAMSLEMARLAVADGTTVAACTPHILPGVFENDAGSVGAAIEKLQASLEEEGIALRLVRGADVHLASDLLAGLQQGRIPTIHNSRYFLFEPPHNIMPPRLEDTIFGLVAAGYVPVITHPERLAWVGAQYPLFERLVGAGAWLQLTAGSIEGSFGRGVRYWSERFLGDGLVHIVASDAHDVVRRPPGLARARERVAALVGAAEAEHLVLTRPSGILQNSSPAALPTPPSAQALAGYDEPQRQSWWRGIIGRRAGG